MDCIANWFRSKSLFAFRHIQDQVSQLISYCVVGFAFAICSDSATPQQLFREPAIPTLDSQVENRPGIDRQESARVSTNKLVSNASPHLGDNQQAVDLGVQQSGSFPQDFVTPNFNPLTARDQNALENIQGVEANSGSLGANPQSVSPPALKDVPENNRTKDGREIIRQRYPDGKVQIEREVAQDENGNYFNQGLWRVFDKTGNVVAQGEYDHGRMHGRWERKHTSQSGGLFATKPFSLFQSPFTSTATFANGKLDGVWTISDAYERKIFEVPYKNGQRNGTATWWYPTMNKMRVVTFKDGLIDGKLLEWDDQNKLTRDEEYYEGQKLVRNVTFYRPNQREAENYYREAKLQVEGTDDWWDARRRRQFPRASASNMVRPMPGTTMVSRK